MKSNVIFPRSFLFRFEAYQNQLIFLIKLNQIDERSSISKRIFYASKEQKYFYTDKNPSIDCCSNPSGNDFNKYMPNK
jgi:hypothetical protein